MTCTAITLHEDSVRRRERAAKRAAIQQARAGKPMPSSREQHRAMLGIKAGVYHDPFSRRRGARAVAYACACGSLLVQSREGGPLPCAWCASQRDLEHESDAEARLATHPPARLAGLDTSRAPVSMPAWAVAALVVMALIAGLAWLDRAHRAEERAGIQRGVS